VPEGDELQYMIRNPTGKFMMSPIIRLFLSEEKILEKYFDYSEISSNRPSKKPLLFEQIKRHIKKCFLYQNSLYKSFISYFDNQKCGK
jgi:hypothetical protein